MPGGAIWIPAGRKYTTSKPDGRNCWIDSDERAEGCSGEIHRSQHPVRLVVVIGRGIRVPATTLSELDLFTKFPGLQDMGSTVATTGCMDVPGGGKKHRGVACPNTTTCDDPDRGLGINRLLLIRMIRQGTEHLGSLRDGVFLGLPSMGSTAEHALNTERPQFTKGLLTICKQIKGPMKPDLESVVAGVKRQGSSCDEIDPTVKRAGADDDSLQTSAACLLDLGNGKIQTSVINQEVRELQTIRYARHPRPDQSVDLGTPPHRLEKSRHQCTRCGPPLLVEIAAEFEAVDQNRSFGGKVRAINCNFEGWRCQVHWWMALRSSRHAFKAEIRRFFEEARDGCGVVCAALVWARLSGMPGYAGQRPVHTQQAGLTLPATCCAHDTEWAQLTERTHTMTFPSTHHKGSSNRSEHMKPRRGSRFSKRGALVAAFIIAPTLATPSLGQEHSRVNPAGGPGLSQHSAMTSPNPEGTSVFWHDTRELHGSIRMKRITPDGRTEGEEISIITAEYGAGLSLLGVTPIDDARTIVSWMRMKTAEEQAADEDSSSKLYLNAIFDSHSGRQLTRAVRGATEFMVDEDGTIWSCGDLESGVLIQHGDTLQTTGLALDTGAIRQSPDSFALVEDAQFAGNSFIRILAEFDSSWVSARQAHVFCTESGRGYRYELGERGSNLFGFGEVRIAASETGAFQMLCNDVGDFGSFESTLHRFSEGGARYHGSMQLKLPDGLAESMRSQTSFGFWANEDESTACYMNQSRIYSIAIDEHGTIPGSEREFELAEINADGFTASEYTPNAFAWLGSSQQLVMATTVERDRDSDVVAITFDPADGGSMQEIAIHGDVRETNCSKMKGVSNASGQAIVSWYQNSHLPDSAKPRYFYIERYDSDGRSMGEPERFHDYAYSYRLAIGEDGSNAFYWKKGNLIKVWHCRAGENRGRLISVELESTNQELTFESVRIAMGENGAFALVADSGPENMSDRLVIRRFDSEGNPLDESPISMGQVAGQYCAWALQSAWMHEGQTYLIARGTCLTDGQLVGRDSLFKIDANGFSSGIGTDITGSTDETIRTVQNGARGRFLVIRDSHMSIHEMDGTKIGSQIGFPEGCEGTSIDAAARADGGWSLATRELTWEVSPDGSIETNSLTYYPMVIAEGVREEIACTRVGDVKAVFTREPFTLNSGFDVVRFDFPDEQCGYGDLNCDGRIDVQDLTHLLAGWGTESGDLNADGNTDGADLAELLSLWSE